MNEKISKLINSFPRGVVTKDLDKQKVPMAAWANPHEILTSNALAWDSSKILLGAIDNHLIGVKDDRHICTIAGSRAGKGVSAIIPNFIHYRGSILAIDPKGELASITAQRRAQGLGQNVVVLDPFDRTAPWVEPYKKSFNPLSFLTPESPTVVEDAGLIADALVVSSPNADPHWDDSSRSFIEGVILHVATFGGYKEIRDLVTVHRLLSIDKQQDSEDELLNSLIEEMLYNAETLPRPELAAAIEASALDFSQRPDREKGSVLSTLRRHIRFLGYESMQKVLQNNDFQLTDLKNDPKGMTIYLCLPAGRLGTCNRWLRLFVNLVLEAMEREKKIPDHPVLLCLDEFAILGHMKQVEDAAGQIAGFGVKLWPILQDLTQLKTLYKDRWETFMGNAGILQFFGNNDVTTLEYIQRRLGKTPVMTSRLTDSPKEAVTGVSKGMEMHDLITAEEAARFFSRSEGKQLVIWAGKDPMVLERIIYHDKTSPLHQHFKGKFNVLE